MKSATTDPISYKIAFFVYGLSVILMFLSSAIYHSLNVQTKTEELFRMFDHFLIYVVIAGTYTLRDRIAGSLAVGNATWDMAICPGWDP